MKKILVLSPGDKNIKNIVRDFVYGCWCRGRRIGGMQVPPLNLLYVATVLKESGMDVELIDAGVNYPLYHDFLQRANQFMAVVILSSTNSFKNDVQVTAQIKRQNPEIKSIFFGSHPTFMPESCIQEEVIDILVFREPEFVIRDVLQKMLLSEDWKEVRGIGYKHEGRLMTNAPYPFIPMDDLPIPDRTLLPSGVDYFNPVVRKMPYTTMQTSRGCPAKCNFCTVPYFYGQKARIRSPENVLNEIRYLTSLGFKEIFFRDETFTVYQRRNREVLHAMIKENLAVSWIANARVDSIDRETLRLMKRAGCHMIKFGVESGSQEILDNIHKGITLDQTSRAFRLCHEVGIQSHAHVMIGCIGETRKSIWETIEFVKRLDPTTVSFGILTPYPGTPLFQELVHLHPELADGTDATMENLHTSGFYNEYFTRLSRQEIERSVVRAYRAFYVRPSYLIKRLMEIDSFDNLMRLLVAGSNIFSFSMTGKN